MKLEQKFFKSQLHTARTDTRKNFSEKLWHHTH